MKNTGRPTKQFPRFWTLHDEIDYEAETTSHMRHGKIRKCGKCKRGVIAHGDSLLRRYCLVCGGETRKMTI